MIAQLLFGRPGGNRIPDRRVRSASLCPTELRTCRLVGEVGFEPTNSWLRMVAWTHSPSLPMAGAYLPAADTSSLASCCCVWWALRGSNPRHPPCHDGALPAELSARGATGAEVGCPRARCGGEHRYRTESSLRQTSCLAGNPRPRLVYSPCWCPSCTAAGARRLRLPTQLPRDIGLHGRIRTGDLLFPKQARYQTALREECGGRGHRLAAIATQDEKTPLG